MTAHRFISAVLVIAILAGVFLFFYPNNKASAWPDTVTASTSCSVAPFTTVNEFVLQQENNTNYITAAKPSIDRLKAGNPYIIWATRNTANTSWSYRFWVSNSTTAANLQTSNYGSVGTAHSIMQNGGSSSLYSGFYGSGSSFDTISSLTSGSTPNSGQAWQDSANTAVSQFCILASSQSTINPWPSNSTLSPITDIPPLNDYCNNLDGLQLEIPTGFVDNAGSCITPSTDPEPALTEAQLSAVLSQFLGVFVVLFVSYKIVHAFRWRGTS